VQHEIQNYTDRKSQNDDRGCKTALGKKGIITKKESQQETDIADEGHSTEK
jgi:hypothetical protein